MIRLGKVYAGLMVDVQASNAKIAERRENMLIHLTGTKRKPARDIAIDYRETAPAATTKATFLNAEGEAVPASHMNFVISATGTI